MYLTPWDNEKFVCDVCGYGKNSMKEFRELQLYINEEK